MLMRLENRVNVQQDPNDYFGKIVNRWRFPGWYLGTDFRPGWMVWESLQKLGVPPEEAHLYYLGPGVAFEVPTAYPPYFRNGVRLPAIHSTPSPKWEDQGQKTHYLPPANTYSHDVTWVYSPDGRTMAFVDSSGVEWDALAVKLGKCTVSIIEGRYYGGYYLNNLGPDDGVRAAPSGGLVRVRGLNGWSVEWTNLNQMADLEALGLRLADPDKELCFELKF